MIVTDSCWYISSHWAVIRAWFRRCCGLATSLLCGCSLSSGIWIWIVIACILNLIWLFFNNFMEPERATFWNEESHLLALRPIRFLIFSLNRDPVLLSLSGPLSLQSSLHLIEFPLDKWVSGGVASCYLLRLWKELINAFNLSRVAVGRKLLILKVVLIIIVTHRRIIVPFIDIRRLFINLLITCYLWLHRFLTLLVVQNYQAIFIFLYILLV
jgi:hypothetical protein